MPPDRCCKYQLLHKRLAVPATRTSQTRQQQKIRSLRDVCRKYNHWVPVNHSTWRPRRAKETVADYRRRVVHTGDGDVLGFADLMDAELREQTALLDLVAGWAGEEGATSLLRRGVCQVCDRTFYSRRAGAADDPPTPLCALCRAVAENTARWCT